MTNKDFHIRAVQLAKILRPDVHNKEISVAEISGEKQSTVRNWLFSSKVPARGKRLTIADKFGVDIGYLFEAAVFNVPLTQFDESLNCYLVPKLSLKQLPCLFLAEPVPIEGRTVISLSDSMKKYLTDIGQTYCLVSSQLNFTPVISADDTLFINLSAKPLHGNFFIHLGKKVQIVMLEKSGVITAENGSVVIRDSKDQLLPIIIIMTTSYVKHV